MICRFCGDCMPVVHRYFLSEKALGRCRFIAAGIYLVVSVYDSRPTLS